MGYHLLVLVHGLWGNVSHFDYIASQLKAQYPSTLEEPEEAPADNAEYLVIYRTRGNEGYFTYDGIDVCGTRVAHEIQREIARLNALPVKTGDGKESSCLKDAETPRVTKISIVGYSLGGLISRYAVGILQREKTFETVQPVSFTTFCSPHVGVLAPGSSFSVRLFNSVTPLALGATGTQLFLRDNHRATEGPLLRLMASPNSVFYKGLSLFSRRTVYSNILNDKRTAWWTSAISASDPFNSIYSSVSPAIEDLHFIPGYDPVVIDLAYPLKISWPTKSELNSRGVDKSANSGNGAERLRENEPWAPGLKWFSAAWKIMYFLLYTPLWTLTTLAGSFYESFNSHRRLNSFLRQHPALDWQDQADDMIQEVYEAIAEPHESRLPLAPAQVEICANLNLLKWHKFPVLIRHTPMSHAAAIVRHPDKNFDEGEVVVAHWIKEVLPV